MVPRTHRYRPETVLDGVILLRFSKKYIAIFAILKAEKTQISIERCYGLHIVRSSIVDLALVVSGPYEAVIERTYILISVEQVT